MSLRKEIVIISFMMVLTSCSTAVETSRDFAGPDSDGDKIVAPSRITGAQLASFQNTRNRCTFTQVVDNQYNLSCKVTVIGDDDREYVAQTKSKELSVQWNKPKVEQGHLAGDINCKLAPSDLSFDCQLATASPSVKLSVELKVLDLKTQESRIEKDSVFLPYSVGVIGGHVPSLNLNFVQGKSSVKGSQNIQLGFETNEISSINQKAIPADACARDGSVFYVSGSQIFQTTAQKTRLWAGLPSERKAEDLSHRLRLSFSSTIKIYCAPSAIYVHDVNNYRLLKLQNDGKIEVIISRKTLFHLHMSKDFELMFSYFNEMKYNGMPKRVFTIKKISKDGQVADLLEDIKPPKDPYPTNLVQCLGLKCFLPPNLIRLAYSPTAKKLLYAYISEKDTSYTYHHGLPKLALVDVATKEVTDLSFEIDPASGLTSAGIFGIQSIFLGEEDEIVLKTVLLENRNNYYQNEKYFRLNPNLKSFSLMSELGNFKDFHQFLSQSGGESNPYTIEIKDIVTKDRYLQARYTVGGQVVIYKQISPKSFELVLSTKSFQSYLASMRNHNPLKTEIADIQGLAINSLGDTYFLSGRMLFRITHDQRIEYLIGNNSFDDGSGQAINPKFMTTLRFADVAIDSQDRVYLLGIADPSVYMVSPSFELIKIATIPDAMSISTLPTDEVIVGGRGFISIIEKNGTTKKIFQHNFWDLVQVAIEGDGENESEEFEVESQLRPSPFRDLFASEGFLYATFGIGILKLRLINLDGSWSIDDSSTSLIGSDSAELAVGYKQAVQEGGLQSQVYSGSLNSIAGDDKGRLFIANSDFDQILSIDKWGANEKINVFFDANSNEFECGSGVIAAYDRSDNLDSAIQAGLSKICAGKPYALATYNGCTQADPSKQIFRQAIAQRFNTGTFNIVMLSKPCKSR